MAPDERDRIFDKALARHLGAESSPEDPANLPAREFGRAGECPGPEALAAYHERSLLPEEMNSWKQHIVGCANCQTVLSHLEATDEIPLQAADGARVLGREESAHQVSSPNQGRSAIPAILPSQSRRARLLRGARWQWLAPAGALAAGLLVWIALHEKQPLAPPGLKQVQIATKQAPAPSPASDSIAAQETAPSSNAGRAKQHSPADESASRRARAPEGAAKTDSKREYLAQVSPPKPLADKEKEGGLQKDADVARTSPVDLLRAKEQLDHDGKTADNTRQENAEVQVQTQAANAQLQNLSNANAPKTAGPAPIGQMEAKKMKAVAAAPPPAQPGAIGGVAASYNDSLGVARAIANPRLISPPGSNVMWRVGRSGLIEFSKDGGPSWSRQTSGVLVDLLNGFAPSDQVCWIVGRAGAVLLTADGGAHWKVVQSPFAEDLGGVRAKDALHAVIWNARSTKSFQTSDGGLTWFPIPSP